MSIPKIHVPAEFFAPNFKGKKTPDNVMKDPALHVCGKIFDAAAYKGHSYDICTEKKCGKSQKYTIEYSSLNFHIQLWLRTKPVQDWALATGKKLPMKSDFKAKNIFAQPGENSNLENLKREFECPITLEEEISNPVVLVDCAHVIGAAYANGKCGFHDDPSSKISGTPIEANHYKINLEYFKLLKGEEDDFKIIHTLYEAVPKSIIDKENLDEMRNSSRNPANDAGSSAADTQPPPSAPVDDVDAAPSPQASKISRFFSSVRRGIIFVLTCGCLRKSRA